jgi:hypothetical protein
MVKARFARVRLASPGRTRGACGTAAGYSYHGRLMPGEVVWRRYHTRCWHDWSRLKTLKGGELGANGMQSLRLSLAYTIMQQLRPSRGCPLFYCFPVLFHDISVVVTFFHNDPFSCTHFATHRRVSHAGAFSIAACCGARGGTLDSNLGIALFVVNVITIILVSIPRSSRVKRLMQIP